MDYDGNQRGLCNQMMYVGYSALPPDNFTCISGNVHDIYSRIQDFTNLQESNFQFLIFQTIGRVWTVLGTYLIILSEPHMSSITLKMEAADGKRQKCF